jgi:hypothetical protein
MGHPLEYDRSSNNKALGPWPSPHLHLRDTASSQRGILIEQSNHKRSVESFALMAINSDHRTANEGLG